MNDRTTIFGLLVFSVAMIVLVIPATIPVSFVPPGQIGPRFFPNLLCSAMALISGGLAVAELIKIRHQRTAATQAPPPGSASSGQTSPGEAEDTPEPRQDNAIDNRRAWTAVGIIVGYVMLMAWVGFIPASAAAVVATMILFGERRWWLIGSFASATPLLTWAFATQVLHLPLP